MFCDHSRFLGVQIDHDDLGRRVELHRQTCGHANRPGAILAAACRGHWIFGLDRLPKVLPRPLIDRRCRASELMCSSFRIYKGIAMSLIRWEPVAAVDDAFNRVFGPLGRWAAGVCPRAAMDRGSSGHRPWISVRPTRST